MAFEVKDGFVLVPVKEWKEIEHDLDFLCALQGAGVDNWEGYELAQESMSETEEEDV